MILLPRADARGNFSSGPKQKIFDLLDTRSAGEMRMMGFAGNWRECPFWEPWIAGRKGDSGEGAEQA